MSAVRTTNAVEVPAAGTWEIDPGHADVGFVGRHFGLTKIRGRFTGVTGTVTIADDPEQSTVQVSFDMASVDSGDTSRDDHLRSADFFDVERYPTATFTTTSVEAVGTSGTMTGELTIKDVTRPVRLAIDYLGNAVDPWDNERAVFSATGHLNREDWGLTWNMVLDAGGLVVSKEIAIEIEVELIYRPS